MLNLVREGEEDYIEAIRYRRRLKIFENFLSSHRSSLYSFIQLDLVPGVRDPFGLLTKAIVGSGNEIAFSFPKNTARQCDTCARF